MIYLIAILIFSSAWLLISIFLNIFFNKDHPLDKLKFFEEDYELKEKFENHKTNKISFLQQLLNSLPNIKINEKKSKKLDNELIKADMPITADELFFIKIMSTLFMAFLCFIITKNLFLDLIIAVLIWNIPRFIISKRKKDRVNQFDNQLYEGIMIISNSLKAGYSFLQAVAAVSEETKDPFSKEFKKLFKEMSLGIPEEDALKNLMERMSSGDLKLIINAILIQKDIGGNLSEILDNISDTIRERQRIQDELKTLTAQGRLSGMIVMLIPIFLGLTIYLFNKEYILLLFNTPIGLAMIGASLFNQVLGFFMIRKIIRIDMG